jgi:hypothetical protein
MQKHGEGLYARLIYAAIPMFGADRFGRGDANQKRQKRDGPP